MVSWVGSYYAPVYAKTAIDVSFLYLWRVKNTAAAFKMIVKESGLRGLYRGWVPNVQRAALVNMGGK